MMLLATVFPEFRVAAKTTTDTSNDPLNGLFIATYGVGNVLGAAAATLFVNLILTVAAVREAVELIHIVPNEFLSWWMGETPVIS